MGKTTGISLSSNTTGHRQGLMSIRWHLAIDSLLALCGNGKQNREQLCYRFVSTIVPAGNLITRMRLTRPRRRFIALVALFGLLFQQAVMAAYVCPVLLPPPVSEAIDLPACHEREASAAEQLQCLAHCNAGTTIAEQSPPASVAAAAILVTATTLLVAPVQTLPASWVFDNPGKRGSTPPIRTRYCTLLI